MTSLTITQSDSQVQSSLVYEYCLTVFNSEDNDTQKLTAAFRNIPTSPDWQKWLSGWTDTGYELLSPPQLLQFL